MNNEFVPEIPMADAIEIPAVETEAAQSDELSREEEAKRQAWQFMVHADGSQSRKQWVLSEFREMHGKRMLRSHINPHDTDVAPFDKMVFPDSPAFSEEERKAGARIEASFSKGALEALGVVQKDEMGIEFKTISKEVLKAKKDYLKVWPTVTESGKLMYSIGLPGESLSEEEEW